MGQQQLLLLVLATVIVGLATVAGIQAFSENQQKAEQDALVQRAINIGNDVFAAHNEPTQFGGIDLINNAPSASDIAEAAGYGESADDSGDGISADGAGDGAECDIAYASDTATVTCTSDGSGSYTSGSNQLVQVTVDPTADSEVDATTINETL